ncbi:MAG: SRPBCC family protein [Elainellaceae cyanobacterium]
MLGCWFKFSHLNKRIGWQPIGWFRPLAGTYQAVSSASVDELWRKIVNLADVSWHPLISSTNVPNGLIPKPGLIYQAMTRLGPIPIRIFVERVRPMELLSIRIMAIPGVEERVIYRIESAVCGARVSYSVTLRGWLSPLIWSVIRGYAAKVPAKLAHAAEHAAQQNQPECGERPKFVKSNFQDLLGTIIVVFTVGQGLI